MLQPPTMASHSPEKLVEKPHSSSTPGMCVVRNEMWKPQTKKPAVTYQKLGSRSAVRASIAAASTAASTAAGRCRNTDAAGSTSSTSATKASIAPCQPMPPISTAASGANTSWPAELPALTRPIASPRFSAGTRCATAPISRGAPPAAAPAAPASIRLAISAALLPATVISASPAAESTPPATTTRAVP